MPQLSTPLSIDECLRILREQISSMSLFSRFLRSNVSPVLGRIDGHSFFLESSKDHWSKRFIGRLAASAEMTVIDYEWKKGLGHRLHGDGPFDEEVILSFLREWLKAGPK